MSLNEEYAKLMGNGVKALVENHTYEKTTNHATFDSSKLVLPEGITEDSMKTHVNFINNTGGMVRNATAEIAREQFKSNDKLTTVDATLSWGGVTWNSQHNLSQKAGDDTLYGHSTTTTDYAHSSDFSQWTADQDKANIEMATKLFS